MTVQALTMKSRDMLRDLIATYWKQVKEAPLQGRRVAWCSGISPIDLLKVMDFTLVFPENYAATCSARKVSTMFCERAESFGYSPDVCSYARNGLGSVLSGDVEHCPVGGLPRPDLLLINSYCAPITKWFEELSRFFKVPLIIVEQPFRHDNLNPQENKELVRQAMQQLRDIVAFLEQFTRKRFDYDRLQESVAVSSQCSLLWNEVLEMGKHIPAPFTCFDYFNSLFPIMCLRGEPATVTYYQQLKSDLAERASRKIGAIPQEKYRLYWDNIPIWFKLRELSQKFASYNANLITGIYPYTWALTDLDPKQPLESITRSMIYFVTNAGIRGRADFITKLVQDYSLDGLVAQSSRSCRLMNMGQYDIMNLVTQRTGCPAVFIEGDMCDERVYSESEVDSKIDAFMELLAQRSRAS